MTSPEDREGEIFVMLAQLDLRAIRAIRYNDTDALLSLNNQSDALRQELQELLNAAVN